MATVLQRSMSARKVLCFLLFWQNGQVRGFDRVASFCTHKYVNPESERKVFLSGAKCAADYSADDEVFGALKNLESLSPSKKASQRVGCILQSDDSLLVTASNTFLNNVGVHAEMNAISQYLKGFSKSEVPLVMTVSFSPCAECASLILLLPEVRMIRYIHEYGDDGIEILEKAGVIVSKLNVTGGLNNRGKSLKLHSYSKIPWVPDVTEVIITHKTTSKETAEEAVEKDVEELLISHSASVPFDIRPYIIRALKIRNQGSGFLCLSYWGVLNHREKLFLLVAGIRIISRE